MIEKRNIIFLDIDGVLNSTTYMKRNNYYDYPIDIVCLKLLKKLVDKTNSLIVLSSSWRKGFNKKGHSLIPLYNDFFSNFLLNSFKNFELSLFDITSVIKNDDVYLERSLEISQWLQENENIVKNYVIIDDETIKLHNGHFVKTNLKIGLTVDDVNKALSILEVKEQ